MSAALAQPVSMPLSSLEPRLAPQSAARSVAQSVARSVAGRILFISCHPSTSPCASALASALQVDVELATNRRAGLAALRRREYTLLLLEEGLAASDPGGCDLLWQNAGLALPLEVNLSQSSCQRVLRDVRAALSRRHREHALSRHAAVVRLESELKSSLAGLLLQSELALREPAVPAALLNRLRKVAALAGDLRKRLQPRQGLGIRD